jgi:predicted DsbA family dithiol-disulfide isomerase
MIGKVPLDQLVKEKNIEVEWKAFELRPEGVEIPSKSPEYMERAKAGVEALSRQHNIVMKWNDKSKHSRLAHEGAKFAEEHGQANAYHDAVFSAQFQQEKDINDVSTLTDIAASIGLNSDAFLEALKAGRYRDAVEKDLNEAQQIGVTAVPCFIAGNRGVLGAQSYESLLRLLEGSNE